MSEGPAETNPPAQESLVPKPEGEQTDQGNPPSNQERSYPPQQAFDELKALMGQMEHDSYIASTRDKDYRRKVFWDGEIMEINFLQRGPTHLEPQIAIRAFKKDQEGNTETVDVFEIIPGGLYTFRLHFQEISIGDRNSKRGDVCVTSAEEPTASGKYISMPNSLIPLESIVRWVKRNVASSKYIPFPPITLSSHQGAT